MKICLLFLWYTVKLTDIAVSIAIGSKYQPEFLFAVFFQFTCFTTLAKSFSRVA